MFDTRSNKTCLQVVAGLFRIFALAFKKINPVSIESVYFKKITIVVLSEIIGKVWNSAIIKFVEALIKVFRHYYRFLTLERNSESIIINFIVLKAVMSVARFWLIWILHDYF